MLQQWSRCLGIAICIFRIKKRSCQVWQGWFLFVNELRRGFCVPFRKLTYHIPPLENHDHLQKCLSRGSVRFLDSGGFVWMLRCVKDVWSYTFVGGMSDQYRSFGLPMSQSAKCLTFLNCWPWYGCEKERVSVFVWQLSFHIDTQTPKTKRKVSGYTKTNLRKKTMKRPN